MSTLDGQSSFTTFTFTEGSLSSSEEQPAFFHSYEYLRGHKLGVIRLNPEVSERMSRDGLRETLHPRQLPMLVKPKPWLSYDQGGYLYSQSATPHCLLRHRIYSFLLGSAMRFKDSQEQQSYLRHASEQGNLELVYAGLDVLGSTPWQVNRKVFDVVLNVWNSGERMCKIPPAVYDLPEPQKPENYESDPKARLVYLTRQKVWSEGKANNHSDRCSVNYKIEIARAVSYTIPLCPSYRLLTLTIYYSSWATSSTSLTTWTSVAEHTPSRHT